MTHRNSRDFFESIRDFHHNIGIYLTYTLDTPVIDKLRECTNGATILILHDYTQGKNLDDNDGSRIVCLPVKTLNENDKNCFHSKLAFLKGENSVKLILGSTNLSKESFKTEKEIALELELKFTEKDDFELYKKVLKYLYDLNEFVLGSREILLKALEPFDKYPENSSSTQIEFVFNSKTDSIFNNLMKYLTENKKQENANKIKIATPFVSKEYPHIEELKKISNDAIEIYLRNGALIEPFKNHEFKILQPKEKHKTKRKGFHAKLVVIEYQNDAVLYIGSANFTEQGFFKNLDEGANQECGIILTIDKKMIDFWFKPDLWDEIKKETFEEYQESKEDNSTNPFEDNEKYYAWAEKRGKKIITYIFNPDKKNIFQSGKEIKFPQYGTEHLFEETDKLKADKDNIITFEIGEDEQKISVFEFEEYQSISDNRGEDIFANFWGLRSIDKGELQKAILKEGVSISIPGAKVKITKPVLLEESFKNIHLSIRVIKKKEFLGDYKEEQIRRKLSKDNSPSTLFFAYYLYSELRKNGKHPAVQEICKDSIHRILNENKEFDLIKSNFIKSLEGG